jgi:dTDP-4-amino-4,6-dideoxygalactose transaminase
MVPAAKPIIGRSERRAVQRVMKSGMLAQGPEVASFENEFSKTIGSRHCIAVNSGTSALHLSFLAAGVGPGDEIIVPSFSFAATANAVALTGATPVFADVEENYFNLDPQAAESLITPKTKGIMPVHLYGHPANMAAFQELCQKHNLLLFEDAAQSVGAIYTNKPVGTFGITASFSFYPTKNMTSGEGGMVATDSDEIARRVKLLRNQGMEKRYANEIIGFNNRMTDLHAAIGRVQLKRVQAWTATRQRNATFLSENIKGVVTPPVSPDSVHVFHQYTIRIVGLDRDKFSEELSKRGIGNGVYYPTPIHRLPSFSSKVELPTTEKVAAECLSLPVHPSLSKRDLHSIVESVNAIASGGA